MEEALHHRGIPTGTMPRPESPSKLVARRSHAGPEKRDRSRSNPRPRIAPSSSNADHQHHSHRHRHSHSHRKAAKETVHSAFELRPPISFDHLLRRDRKTPNASRRNSGTASGSKDVERWTIAQQQADASRRRALQPEQMEKVRRENEKSEKELREGLQRLEERGMQSTRRLDETYYMLLEKAATLRQTVAAMQDLVRESQAARDRFQSQSADLQREAESGLSGFDDFADQEKTVQSFVDRLDGSKSRTQRLNDRLAVAMKGVEAYERKLRAAQAKRRKQLGFTWASVLAIVVLIFALLVARHHKELEVELDGYGRRIRQAGDMVDDVASPLVAKLSPSPSENPYLHDLFDGIS